MKILIAYDGTIHAKNAVSYGLEKARSEGGRILVLQVFDPTVFIDYGAGPGAEQLSRAEAKRMHQEAEAILREQGAGIDARMVFQEGDAAALVAHYAEEERFDLILVPPKFKGLARSLSRPVLVIPGTILVPVDNTDAAYQNLESILREARGTGSQVHVAGIVPVHLYSRNEKAELEQVKAETRAAMQRLSAALRKQNIQTTEEMRSGYSDDEILKAAQARTVSLILLPSGGTTPSELSKAAAIILEEPEQLKWPVFLFPATGAA